jgi:hypothetical protein
VCHDPLASAEADPYLHEAVTLNAKLQFSLHKRLAANLNKGKGDAFVVHDGMYWDGNIMPLT